MLNKLNKIRRRFTLLSRVGSALIILSTLTVAIIWDYRAAGSFVLAISTITSGTFCILYNRSRWRETAPGRAVMYTMASYATVGVIVCLSLFFGSGWPGRDQIRLAAYLSVAVALFNIATKLVRFQRESKTYREFGLPFTPDHS